MPTGRRRCQEKWRCGDVNAKKKRGEERYQKKGGAEDVGC